MVSNYYNLAIKADLVTVLITLGICLFFLEPKIIATEVAAFNINILQAVEEMPIGGNYAATKEANRNLASSIQIDGENFTIVPELAKPSYCSSATYLVFLKALSNTINSIADPLKKKELIQKLRVNGQADGFGIWGRWNSNGPCMAKLIADAKIGRSFWNYEDAKAGDFLKIWWKDAIGKDEAGHSVVFLGFTVNNEGEHGIEIWSSNKPNGYGRKFVPFVKIHHTLFTRCEAPENIEKLTELTPVDTFLRQMLTHNTSISEINAVVGLENKDRLP
jgi:hypothetical protein